MPVESPARAPRGANAAYVGVLLIVVSAVVATATTPGHWLRATLGLGAGVGIAAAARALLPARYAGLLAVRGRRFDAFCLGALAVLIVTVGLLIPR
ncbi:MAG: DUF3017 domain-containing protein [Frankiaceae bacterium]|nr:DUF3017 domain-containing protein [Frankiaceae bacterium]